MDFRRCRPGAEMSTAVTREPAARKAWTVRVPMWPAAPVMRTWVSRRLRERSIGAWGDCGVEGICGDGGNGMVGWRCGDGGAVLARGGEGV